MSTLYARIHPKRGVARFFRCGTAFTQAWLKLENVDTATAKRLREEQMLEVEATEPEGFALQEENDLPPAAGGERLHSIRDAIAQLDPEDQSLWTGNGKPKTEAISAILGWNVSAIERDAAMAQSGQGEEQA